MGWWATAGVSRQLDRQGFASLPDGAAQEGLPFSWTVATFPTSGSKISAKGKLPPGVKFHKGTGTAILSGTPSAQGTYSLKIKATYGKGKTKQVLTQTYTLFVFSLP